MSIANCSTEEIVHMYEEGLSLQAIADKVGFKSAHSIRNLFLKLGIERRNKAGSRNINLRNDYFGVLDTEDKAYFAGLLLADGSVNTREKSQPCIRIELASTDGYIIHKLKEVTNSNNTVREAERDSGFKRNFKSTNFNMHSQQMFDDLAKYGVVPNKTNNKMLMVSDIPENMRRHFIRGFFDGNGYVTRNGFGTSKLHKVIGFSDSVPFLEQLREYLHNTIQTKNTLKVASHKEGNSNFITYGSKKDVDALVNYMYSDATIYLVRKYDKAHANIEGGTQEVSSVTHRE